MMEEGMSVTEVAKAYGVSRQRIYQIIQADNKKKERKGIMASSHPEEVGRGEHRVVDPETGLVVERRGQTAVVIGRMGDEKVTAFVAYHMAMLQMREGVDKKDVADLRQRLLNYLSYCMEHGIIPNNMNAYFAIGITRQEVSAWKLGNAGTPEHRKFAEEITSLFASIHEQGGVDGIINPILSIFWAKAHDGLSDQPKIEVQVTDPLGERASAEDIAARYADVELPDD